MLICVDEVETLGPSSISGHRGVIYVVNVGLDAILHGGFTLASNFSAFFYGGGVIDAGVFEFPSIFGMGFPNVDDEELDLFVVLGI